MPAILYGVPCGGLVCQGLMSKSVCLFDRKLGACHNLFAWPCRAAIAATPIAGADTQLRRIVAVRTGVPAVSGRMQCT